MSSVCVWPEQISTCEVYLWYTPRTVTHCYLLTMNWQIKPRVARERLVKCWSVSCEKWVGSVPVCFWMKDGVRWCVTKLREEEAEAAGQRRGGGGAEAGRRRDGTQNQKQEPHTKMWGTKTILPCRRVETCFHQKENKMVRRQTYVYIYNSCPALFRLLLLMLHHDSPFLQCLACWSPCSFFHHVYQQLQPR